MPDEKNSIEHDTIEIDTPPPSPIPWIPSAPDITSEVICSPSKAMRVGKPGRRKRKRQDEPSTNVIDSEVPRADDGWIAIQESVGGTEEPEPTDDNSKYTTYVDAVLADDAAVYQIFQDLFVVSGWDVRKECNQVREMSKGWYSSALIRPKNVWYHLQVSRFGAEVIPVCTCPQARIYTNSHCFHARFLLEYREDKFPDDGTFTGRL